MVISRFHIPSEHCPELVAEQQHKEYQVQAEKKQY
jgi:hypothetical protein